jgi:hypothetical protein
MLWFLDGRSNDDGTTKAAASRCTPNFALQILFPPFIHGLKPDHPDTIRKTYLNNFLEESG